MKCRKCGKEFIPKSRNEKFCSDECRAEQNRNAQRKYRKSKQVVYTKTCVICGKEFETHRAVQYTCGSRECRKARENIASKERNRLKCKHKNTLVKKVMDCESQGISYAEMQRRETIEMYGRVII